MTKRIVGSYRNGEKHWILIPDIAIKNYSKASKKITYLDLFYYFGQCLLTFPSLEVNQVNDAKKKNINRIK